MICQTFRIEDYDWNVKVFYNASEKDSFQIKQCLYRLECDEDTIDNLDTFLKEINSGFTYSNLERRSSVIIINETSSARQFVSTLDHEKGHLSIHLATYYNINPYGEELQYIVSTISEKMYPISSLFMCSQCREQSGIN